MHLRPPAVVAVPRNHGRPDRVLAAAAPEQDPRWRRAPYAGSVLASSEAKRRLETLIFFSAETELFTMVASPTSRARTAARGRLGPPVDGIGHLNDPKAVGALRARRFPAPPFGRTGVRLRLGLDPYSRGGTWCTLRPG